MVGMTATHAGTHAISGQDIHARFIVLALGVITLAGLWLRLRHLGALPLIGDEAIQAMAVRGVLEHGIPQMETGFVYTRALLYTYLQAIPAAVFGVAPDEFWLRFPSAVFGVLVIFPVYWLARELAGWRVALLAALFIALSSWEIELSRYARFYTFFQFTFVLALYCFYRGFLRNQRVWRYAFLGVSFISFFTHEMSMLLFLLYMIPLATGEPRHHWRLLVWWVAFVLIWYGQRYLTGWVSHMGLAFDSQPAVMNSETLGRDILSRLNMGLPNLYYPDWLPWLEIQAQHPAILWIPVLVAAGAIARVFVQAAGQPWYRVVLACSAILLAVGYQFGLSLLLLLLLVIWASPHWRGLHADRLLRSTAVGCGLLLGFWLAVFSASPADWKAVALLLFGVPNVLQHFAYWFILGLPFLSAVVVLTAVWQLRNFLADRDNTAALYLPAVILVMTLSASFVQSYYESRYVFHLYPALVILYCLAVMAAVDGVDRRLQLSGRRVRSGVAAAVLMLGLVLSHDANPLFSWRIGDRDFGTPRNPLQSVISWPRYAGFHADREFPADYYRLHRQEADRVLTLGPVFMHTQFHYYAGGVDASLNQVGWPTSYGRLRDGRLVNYLTGAELVAGNAGIQAYLQQSPGAVWILGDLLLLADDNDYYSPDVKAALRELVGDPQIKGRDGVSFLATVKTGNNGKQ